METTEPTHRKLPAKIETHAKYAAIADERGWSLTMATDRIVNDFIARHGVRGGKRHRRAQAKGALQTA